MPEEQNLKNIIESGFKIDASESVKEKEKTS